MRKPKQKNYAYDARIALWLSRDPIWEQGGLNLYGMVGNDPIKWLDFIGLGQWNITEKGINLSGPGISVEAFGFANSDGFEVQYIPDSRECPKGKIVLFQIISEVGTSGSTAQVDGKLPAPGSPCPLPPEMKPPGSTKHSYIDSPTGSTGYLGIKTQRITAVAVCRDQCKDEVLSKYYF